ncbi:hypothetical protein OG895_18750 [Streptomyces sp. NBC_00201]|uniref:hypothetical protein n=1 Tax=unclassified Streptomyces TaxID=2593676 RepID=UPI00225793B7|nr:MULTISPECIES: hypothetical protein [unclassified Streptomyces]MCX5055922.1 hypothetical protein [Streptomyces sp. NBC_00452]MCX5247224.1 hypothetical protein [Streptomyces sp. NBC_00201]MCX5287015.1 hypothetical protein [Streptomyces sp. NBC_00183]
MPPTAAADRVLFRRIQELTLAGRTDDEIEAALPPAAGHVFVLLAAAVGDYPTTGTS